MVSTKSQKPEVRSQKSERDGLREAGFLSLLLLASCILFLLCAKSSFSQHVTSKEWAQAKDGGSGDAQDTPAEKMYQVATGSISAKAFTDKSNYLVGDSELFCRSLGLVPNPSIKRRRISGGSRAGRPLPG